MPSPELFFDTIWAYQRSAALKAALDLEVFTAIGDGARTAGEIAAACQASERGVRILCDYLSTIDLLQKSGTSYALPEIAAVFLTKRSPAYLGSTAAFLYSEQLRGDFAALTETVRRGTAGTGVIAADHPVWVDFARAMVPRMMPTAQAMAEALDVASAGPLRVLDIAAGHGIFGIVVAQRNPQAEIVAVDWGAVLQVAVEHATAMGVADRYTTRPGDAFTLDYGSGFSLALLPNFLHHFDRDTNVQLLRKVAAALDPGGRAAIVEFVPNADRVTPPMAARFSLVMLATTPAGDAYTRAELEAMLMEAGFSSTSVHPLGGPETLVVGTR